MRRKEDLSFKDEIGCTKQSFSKEGDINYLMSRYLRSGEIPQGRGFSAMYADFSSSEDYHTVLSRIANARDSFHSLPSSLREKFDNDPGKFLDYLKDPSNFDEHEKFGIEAPSPEDRVDGPASEEKDCGQCA